MQGAIFFPGVRSEVSENLITEAHGLLQDLNKSRNNRLYYFLKHSNILVKKSELVCLFRNNDWKSTNFFPLVADGEKERLGSCCWGDEVLKYV